MHWQAGTYIVTVTGCDRARFTLCRDYFTRFRTCYIPAQPGHDRFWIHRDHNQTLTGQNDFNGTRPDSLPVAGTDLLVQSPTLGASISFDNWSDASSTLTITSVRCTPGTSL